VTQAHGLFQLRLSVVDEIEADVGGTVVRSLCSGPGLREQDRLARDVIFRQGGYSLRVSPRHGGTGHEW
jgi:hypothetical protein